jgi:hypothetical protein
LERAASVDGNLERYDRTDIEIGNNPKDYSTPTPGSLVEQHCRPMTAPLAGVHGIAGLGCFLGDFGQGRARGRS